ncbi:hypothetical protein [Fredinandcohnia quinoae]|uniref:Threonine dehydratase n=1 Tax=Fredinandcohnia quinoae TaxID=2918902 RepID=A0AAW5E554_9BACI|nr:hypothetical protein [Fredinandcohnia sp. SECRCQ15]MCH1626375.1 hypothetical protein [Fredinandcohnia sp. SECRCQ15]
MEYSICSLDSALPCEITVDDDNGRYMIRKSDSSGEIFNSAEELIAWINTNWSPEEFCDPNEFTDLIIKLNSYDPITG